MPPYTTFEPKPYRPRMSPYWYFDRWHYLKFMVRELSCIFVAYFAVVMLLQIYAISSGPDAYACFQSWMRSPVILILNAAALLFIIFHAITWFALVPRVFVRHVTGTEIPNIVTMIPNYGVWLFASAVVAVFILRLI
jgi:fumarate reductase subunit C